jgi:hypothetical protein
MAISRVTNVNGTDLAVIARLRLSGASPVLADLGSNARIWRVTGSPCERKLAAPLRPIANIFSTLVEIITKMDEIAAHLMGFVHQSVTVVIQAIAGLFGRHLRVTLLQTVGSADTLAGAGADFIGNFADGPEP